MTLGKAPSEQDIFRSSTEFCGGRLSPTSIYGLLHRECHKLFPDESFADLFDDIGRASVPPRIVSVVMVLQRLEGLSDREAVDRFAFDLRWKYAAGGLDFDYPGFVPHGAGGYASAVASFAKTQSYLRDGTGGCQVCRSHRS